MSIIFIVDVVTLPFHLFKIHSAINIFQYNLFLRLAKIRMAPACQIHEKYNYFPNVCLYNFFYNKKNDRNNTEVLKCKSILRRLTTNECDFFCYKKTKQQNK